MPKKLGGCTISRGHLYRWYKGSTRYVCPLHKAPDAEAAENQWTKVRKAIDRDHTGRPACEATLRELTSDFIAAARRRVETGKPKRLSPRMLHNYITDLNAFGAVVGGSVRVEDIGPTHFAAYVETIDRLKRSGYDSKVAHVRTLFTWATDNEYIDRARYGTAFERPGKQAIRDERIVTPRSFSPGEVALLIDRAGPSMRPMLMLGVAAALNNSEVAWLERGCVDLDAGLLDFRRRKTGRVRRVVPLPEDVAAELRAYVRPEPADLAHADLFFLTTEGQPYVRMTASGQCNTLTKLFRDLAGTCAVKDLRKGKADGRGFAGLRTTHSNLAPPGYRDEVEVILGHARGSILNDHYIEQINLERLRHVTTFVWEQVKKERRS